MQHLPMNPSEQAWLKPMPGSLHIQTHTQPHIANQPRTVEALMTEAFKRALCRIIAAHAWHPVASSLSHHAHQVCRCSTELMDIHMSIIYFLPLPLPFWVAAFTFFVPVALGSP